MSGGSTPASSASASRREARRVEPVLEELPPVRPRHPVAAVVLALGPLLATASLVGFLLLLNGVRHASITPFRPGALALDLVLALQFVLGHSLLARGFGRRLLNRPLGPSGERPLYVLVAGVSLALLVLGWRTCGPLVWRWEDGWRLLAHVLQALGLGLATWGSLVAGGRHLLGLPELRALWTGEGAEEPPFTALPPYSFVRHPVHLGFLVMLTAQPEVTVDRLLLMAVFVAWLLLAVPFEERDLLVRFEGYARYLERTPRWLPRPGARER